MQNKVAEKTQNGKKDAKNRNIECQEGRRKQGLEFAEDFRQVKNSKYTHETLPLYYLEKKVKSISFREKK